YDPITQINKKISTINNFISFDDPVYFKNFLLFSDVGNLYIFNLTDLVKTLEKEETEILTLKIFPNPFHESLTIYTSENESIHPTSVEILNINGDVLKKAEKSGTSGWRFDNLESLDPGLYLIRIKNNELITSQMIFKSK
ncbi:MAG: T9SS type A sorting domain-containing protein, partial [Saprospiraceae bacterium]|nr:T9SS type A sorting domain-containing protein [Saprospiraceae bacterium]